MCGFSGSRIAATAQFLSGASQYLIQAARSGGVDGIPVFSTEARRLAFEALHSAL
jgi:hypothetical protein